ncbi:MAG TPA: M3 family oligoendopeptidase [Phycisphaerales bacterium]|nr:M3 family oligoendopeptidase [Phycisphaerales bacterium]
MICEFTPASDFVPANLDATSWEELRPLYEQLLARPLNSAEDLERLLLDRSELDAAASEAGSILYINMTCRTDDPATTRAYLDFVENVQPRLKETGFELDRKIVQSPHAARLDPDRYRVLLRDLRVGVEIFRPENVPIETELAKLEQEYQAICGAMTVSFRGEEKTLPQMNRYFEEPDRTTREEAWRLVWERRFQDRERVEALYETMIAKRHQVAMNAGFSSYRDYVFKAKRRFDYTPETCHQFAAGVEQVVVPALRRLNHERRDALQLDRLRPWDLAVDVKGRPALRPFETADEMVAKTRRVFRRLDPTLGELFDSLCGGGCLDLDSRKGKAPGGYQSNRDRVRQPFIFMNAAGVQRDVETMVHEAGHAFHALLCRRDPLLAYRSEIPLEFAEVASMSMEMATHHLLDEFYQSPQDAGRAVRVHLEQLATILPWIATIDQFQHWAYTHPMHSRAGRRDTWVGLNARFGPAVDYSGLEPYLDMSWQRQLHLFGAPFYYIEYGIAQLGALQLWLNFRRDPAQALDAYKRALALGGSRPLPELFEAAGLEFDFGPAMIERLWGEVDRELASLPA